MRTTLDLDDGLVRAARSKAVEANKTLTAVIEDALREHLAERAPAPYRWTPRVNDSPPLAGVDLSDRASLFDLLDASS